MQYIAFNNAPNEGVTSLEQMYQDLLKAFQQGSNDDYSQIIEKTKDANLEFQGGNSMDFMKEQYNQIGTLAKQQAQDWLEVNEKLMGQSFGYRSQESRQQFEQDRDMMFAEEGVNNRRRDWERNSAMKAFKDL